MPCEGVGVFTVRKADMADALPVYRLVQKTIRTVYPGYYEPAIVDAFCRFHSLDAIEEDIGLSKVRVLESGDCIVGTGTLDGEHITRVFVLPESQGRGLGTRVMDALEGEAAKSCGYTVLDSSVPAESFHLHRGYDVIDRGEWHIEATAGQPSVTLVYKVMKKTLVRQG